MTRSMHFILLAATAAGAWSVLMSRAAKQVHPVIGAGLIEGSALVLVIALVLRQDIELSRSFTPLGLVLLTLCGLCVFAVDFFSLRAYDMGLAVSVGAPIVAAGAILVPVVVGAALGESLDFARILGIGLIAGGVLILARFAG